MQYPASSRCSSGLLPAHRPPTHAGGTDEDNIWGKRGMHELCRMPLCADYWQGGAEASSGTTGEVHGEMACAIRCRDGRHAKLSLVFRGNGSGLRV